MRFVRILALDTSTELCSAALWREGDIDSDEALAGQRHAELLLPTLDGLLGRYGLKVQDLDGIAYGHGPGSFTGLRIACGVVQGLAFGAGLPVVGVSTLLALARAAPAARVVCCIDARMGQVYHAAYERDGERWVTLHAPALCAPEAAPRLPDGPPWTGCGSGFKAYGAALERCYAGRLSAVFPDAYPHARHIAELAVVEFAQGRTLAAEQAMPVYIRDKVALRSDER